MLNKPLPQNMEAEKQFLSMLFIKNDIVADIINYIKPNDFYKTSHMMIYEKIIQMYSNNIPIDVITFTNSISKEQLSSIGGITYLSEIQTTAMTTAQYKTYAHMIKKLSDQRNIIKNCMEAVATAFENNSDPKLIIDKLESSFVNMNEYSQEGTVNAGELMDSTINMIEENYKNGGQITGISTGYFPIDRATNGFVKGDLLIIAARPSMGKTALTMNMINNIDKKYTAMLFELEMSKEKLGVRMLAPKALKNSTQLARGQIKDEDFGIITAKAGEIANKNNFFLNCKSGLSLMEIRAEAKKIKIKHGLDIIFIDHIGKVRPDNLKASRNDQIGQITEGLKNMAKELDVCVVALSQLSREVEHRADKRPQLSDLRDSGNIEQDADEILFLYRDDYYAEREDRESKNPGIMEILVAKNRDGEVGMIELVYQTEYQIITEKIGMKYVGKVEKEVIQ